MNVSNPPNGAIIVKETFQNDNAPIDIATMKSRFEEHENKVGRPPWPAQLPDLNIIEPLRSTLENKVGSRFPLPATVKELEKVLYEEWHDTLLNIIQDFHTNLFREELKLYLRTNNGPQILRRY